VVHKVVLPRDLVVDHSSILQIERKRRLKPLLTLRLFFSSLLCFASLFVLFFSSLLFSLFLSLETISTVKFSGLDYFFFFYRSVWAEPHGPYSKGRSRSGFTYLPTPSCRRMYGGHFGSVSMRLTGRSQSVSAFFCPFQRCIPCQHLCFRVWDFSDEHTLYETLRIRAILRTVARRSTAPLIRHRFFLIALSSCC
jgi:hypothetical protein